MLSQYDTHQHKTHITSDDTMAFFSFLTTKLLQRAVVLHIFGGVSLASLFLLLCFPHPLEGIMDTRELRL